MSKLKKSIFEGAATALITPFKNGQIDYECLKALIEDQISGGIDALVIAGTTGEAPTLTDSEKEELFRRAKAFVGNDCIILAGSGSNSTAHAVNLSIAAETAGALEVNSDWDITCGDELVPMVSTGLTLPAAGTYLLITSSSTAANNGVWIITDAAVNLAGGSGVTVSVSGTTVTITPSSGTADAFFVRLTAK